MNSFSKYSLQQTLGKTQPVVKGHFIPAVNLLSNDELGVCCCYTQITHTHHLSSTGGSQA